MSSSAVVCHLSVRSRPLNSRPAAQRVHVIADALPALGGGCGQQTLLVGVMKIGTNSAAYTAPTPAALHAGTVMLINNFKSSVVRGLPRDVRRSGATRIPFQPSAIRGHRRAHLATGGLAA
jgi:hypothetical protein